jgi:calcineurin-like phosphoesterase family protein
MIYFTGDQHFSHENIIDYCHRPFNRVGQMNQELIRRYRQVVNPEDTVYFLGDLTIVGPNHKMHIAHIVDQLPGTKILILGNHDKLNPFTYVDIGFQSVHTYISVEEFHLIHDPAISNVNHEFKWLCGHIHILFKKIRNVLNVGVDVWNFFPINITEVRREFSGNSL